MDPKQQQQPSWLFMGTTKKPPNGLQGELAGSGGPRSEKPLVGPSWKRYLMLALFCINSGNKAFQWIQIPASSDKLTAFYNVNNYTINGASTIFMLSFVFLSWPACYLIERVGMRNAVFLASLLTLIGSSIKCCSCHPDQVYLMLAGQVIVACGEQLIFSVPSRLASVWFPDHQVSSAVAISVLGNQLGVALGFLAPQVFLNGAESTEEIGKGLYNMFLATAAVSLFSFLASAGLFEEAPKRAPGLARLKQIQAEEEALTRRKPGFVEEMQRLAGQVSDLLRNRHYLCLTMSFGVNLGFGYTVSTLLNQMMEPLWPGDLQMIGNTGFLLIVGGALLSPFWGRLLDTLHLYLTINWFIAVANICALVLFGYVLSCTHLEWAIYLAVLMLGCFQTGFMVAGLELAVELTYPAPELVTSSLMNVMPQIFGTAFIFAGSHIVDEYGAVAVNLFFLGCLLAGLVLLLSIKESLRRQDAVEEKLERLARPVEPANTAVYM